MSDVVYQPTTDAAPETPEAVTLPNEQEWFDGHRDAGNLPSEGPFADPGGQTPDQVTSERASEKRWLDWATEETRKRRSGLSEFEKPRVTEIKSSRESYTGGSSIKDAARDYTLGRRSKEKATLMEQGHSEADAEALVMGEEPPTEIGVVDRAQNRVLAPLHDEDGRGRRLTEADSLNLRDATRMQGDFREAQAQYQAELLQRLQQQAPDQTAPAEALPEQTEAQPSPQVVAQQEALAQQRQALAQQAAVVAAQQQSVAMSAEVKAIQDDQNRWIAYLKNAYPEANSQQSWDYTLANNPRRAQEINNGFARAKNVFVAQQRRLGELNELYQGRAQRYHAAQAAAHEQIVDAEDARFEETLAKEIPQYATGKARTQLKEAAIAELRSL